MSMPIHERRLSGGDKRQHESLGKVKAFALSNSEKQQQEKQRSTKHLK